jgi:hypothetical protein
MTVAGLCGRMAPSKTWQVDRREACMLQVGYNSSLHYASNGMVNA